MFVLLVIWGYAFLLHSALLLPVDLKTYLIAHGSIGSRGSAKGLGI